MRKSERENEDSEREREVRKSEGENEDSERETDLQRGRDTLGPRTRCGNLWGTCPQCLQYLPSESMVTQSNPFLDSSLIPSLPSLPSFPLSLTSFSLSLTSFPAICLASRENFKGTYLHEQAFPAAEFFHFSLFFVQFFPFNGYISFKIHQNPFYPKNGEFR